MSPPILEVRNLDVRYGRIHAVRSVSIDVNPGEIVALLGPNGGGKTSLLRAVAGVQPSSATEVRFLGKDVRRLKPFARARKGMVLVPEGRSLFADMTVVQNLRVPQIARGEQDRACVDEILQLFPRLAERRDQKTGSLSGGEQQMLAVGRALLSSPKLLLLDEVSLGLHPRIVDDVYAALHAALSTARTPTVVVEQHVGKALELAHRAYVMLRGSIVEQGTAAELSADTHRLTDLYLTEHRPGALRHADRNGHRHRSEVELAIGPATKRRMARAAALRGVEPAALAGEVLAAHFSAVGEVPVAVTAADSNGTRRGSGRRTT